MRRLRETLPQVPKIVQQVQLELDFPGRRTANRNGGLFYLAFGMALASGVRAGAIDVWSFLHRFALGAAVFAGRDRTGTDGVRAFLTV